MGKREGPNLGMEMGKGGGEGGLSKIWLEKEMGRGRGGGGVVQT